MKATSMGAQTMVAYDNCFGLWCEDGKEYHVIDMYREDFCGFDQDPEWPVEVVLIDKRSVAIDDSRWANVKRKGQPCSMCSGHDTWQTVAEAMRDE